MRCEKRIEKLLDLDLDQTNTHSLSSELCSRSCWISFSFLCFSSVRRASAVAILSSSSARTSDSSRLFSAWAREGDHEPRGLAFGLHQIQLFAVRTKITGVA